MKSQLNLHSFQITDSTLYYILFTRERFKITPKIFGAKIENGISNYI